MRVLRFEVRSTCVCGKCADRDKLENLTFGEVGDLVNALGVLASKATITVSLPAETIRAMEAGEQFKLDPADPDPRMPNEVPGSDALN